jgi:signal transduction histidine kinase
MKKENIKKKMLFAALPLLLVISMISIATTKIIANNCKEIARYEAETKAKDISRIIESYVRDLNIWGFVMIVLDLDTISEQFSLDTYTFEGYDYCLYRENGDEMLIAAESTNQKLTDAVEVDVSIPTNIVWKLSVQPKGGWVSRGWQIIILLSDILVFILGMTYIYFYFQKKYIALKDREQQKSLAEALTAAEEANHAKSDFLSRMSHDIRTPLNGIVGMTSIALRDLSNSKKVEDCLHKINQSSEHLCSLINDVLDMSKIESGKVSVNEAPFNIISTAEQCSSIIRGQLVNKQIDFITDFEKIKHSALIGDASLLERIIINILGNSVKFTKEGGKIIFRIEEFAVDEENVLFRMKFHDTGVGMSKEFLPKIFDAFEQELDNGRTDYQGTGLGMAITKQFVEMLNGKIDVKSEQNVGTDFTVEIPFAINHDVKGMKVQLQNEFTLAECKILLVEDNELNSEIAEEILKDEGAEITVTQNGKNAVDICAHSEESYFDLILMDIMMPEMDGLTATRIIRNMKRTDMKTIPIIAMTANAFEDDRKAAMEAGMNGYVTKPINVEVLLREINTVIYKKIKC